MVTVRRGRAASPLRPGFLVKKVLLGEVPLETGELVHEAAITDLHSAYKALVRRENSLRPKARQLRGMTAQSFKTLFKFVQLLDLVELVREEPMLYPPPKGRLYSVRVEAGVARVVTSTRRVFRLTDVGTEDELSWSDLRRAWQESWPAPQKLVEVPVEVPVRVPPKKPPVKVPVAVPRFRWIARPSMRQFGLLLRYLEELQAIGISDPEVKEKVDVYSMKIGDWALEIDDLLDDAKAIQNVKAIETYGFWKEHIGVVAEGLADRDIPRAIEALKELVEG